MNRMPKKVWNNKKLLGLGGLGLVLFSFFFGTPGFPWLWTLPMVLGLIFVSRFFHLKRKVKDAG